MTGLQRGWYIDLIAHAWQEGGLPDDENACRRLTSFHSDLEIIDCLASDPESDSEWRRRFADDFNNVFAIFSHILENGRRSHPKLEDQRVLAELTLGKRQDAARSTNEKRKANQDGHRDGDRALRASYSNSYSSSTEVQEKEKPLRAREDLPTGFALDEQYAKFRLCCQQFGMIVSDPEDFLGDAWFGWKVLDFEQKEAACANILARKEAGLDPRFTSLPAKFIRNREWKRPIPKPKETKSKADQMLDSVVAKMEAASGN